MEDAHKLLNISWSSCSVRKGKGFWSHVSCQQQCIVSWSFLFCSPVLEFWNTYFSLLTGRQKVERSSSILRMYLGKTQRRFICIYGGPMRYNQRSKQQSNTFCSTKQKCPSELRIKNKVDKHWRVESIFSPHIGTLSRISINGAHWPT